MVTEGSAITQADMDALALLANTKLKPLVKAAIDANQNNWAAATWIFSSGNIIGFTGQNIYDIPAAVTDGTQGIMLTQPDYLFDITKKNWQDEFNRIRGDVMEMVCPGALHSLPATGYTGAENIFLKDGDLVSGPWVVGINDPVTWPGALNGVLSGSFGSAVTAPTICLFKHVAFNFFSEDAPSGFSVTGVLSIPQSSSAINSFGNPSFPHLPFTLNYTINADGASVFKVMWSFTGPAGAPPAASGFTTTATPSTGVTWSTIAGVTAGNFFLVATFTHAAAYGDTGSIAFEAYNPPTSYTFDITSITIPGEGTISNFTHLFTGQVTFVTSETQAAITALSPTKTPVQIALGESGARHELLLVNGVYGAATWTVSDATVRGVWTANTLPVPGRNLYVDQDMPPYIDAAQNPPHGPPAGGQVAVSSKQYNPTAGTVPLVSSVRCILNADSPVQSARPAGATAYPVKRDTDFVPYGYGFNQNETLNPNNGPLGAAGSSLIFGFVNLSGATSFKLRIVAAGTGAKGWRSGVLGYGTALAATMRIFVSSSGVPDPTVPTTYDFYVDSNSLNLPPDGPAGYFAGLAGGGIIYAVENLTSGDLVVDIIEETDFGTVVRPYFPPLAEGFSYSIDGTPKLLVQGPGGNYQKMVPQTGYSIFRLRATRLPVNGVVPTTGAAITVKVGQNRLQMDGSLLFTQLLDATSTPITVTIPLNTRDGGDVNVLWPVLAGTELVYQCASQINLEAWVDWQPIFFNELFGIESGVTSTTNYQTAATLFQYALAFANKFDPTLANYGARTDGTFVPVQYPLGAEIYNDLMTLLGLI